MWAVAVLAAGDAMERVQKMIASVRVFGVVAEEIPLSRHQTRIADATEIRIDLPIKI